MGGKFFYLSYIVKIVGSIKQVVSFVKQPRKSSIVYITQMVQ